MLNPDLLFLKDTDEDNEDDTWDKWLLEANHYWNEQESCTTNAYAFDLTEQFKLYKCNLNEQQVYSLFSNKISKSIHPVIDHMQNQWILQHKNSVVIVGIGPNHPLLIETVKRHSDIHNNDLNHNIVVAMRQSIIEKQISGKRKRGAIQCYPDTELCKITFPSIPSLSSSSELHFSLYGCMFGNVIDWNRNLEKNLTDLKDLPNQCECLRSFWVAILLTQANDKTKKLLSSYTVMEQN